MDRVRDASWLLLAIVLAPVSVAGFLALLHNTSTVKDAAEAMEHLTVALAAFVGGGWAFYRFALHRIHETALQISPEITAYKYGDGLNLVSVDISFKNTGKRKLEAKRRGKKGETYLPVYEDKYETLNHSVSLQIRKIRSNLQAEQTVEWEFVKEKERSETTESVCDEMNLAEVYEDTQPENVSFWMEPGESYNMNSTIVLPAGKYLGMVTFVGDRTDSEFWRRVFAFEVSAAAN